MGASILFSGCTASKNIEINSSSMQKRYSSLKINHIKMPKVSKLVHKELLKNALEKELEGFIEPNSRLGVNIVMGEVDEGSRALRYLVPFAGKGKLMGDVESSNGVNRVGKFSVETTLSVGFFGGSADRMFDDFAKEVAIQIKKSFLIKK